SLDWHLLDFPEHAGVQRLVRDLNRYYRKQGALHQLDFTPAGFEWIDHSDATHSVLSFIRRGHDAKALVVAVCNFTPTVRHGYRIGVPQAGQYHECINTDSAHYGGSNTGTPLGLASSEPRPWQGQPHSLLLTLPALATILFEWRLP
ncbi:MAG: alpha amylase C-terminal domain-containing protein, partial [Rhodoferax sp.]